MKIEVVNPLFDVHLSEANAQQVRELRAMLLTNLEFGRFVNEEAFCIYLNSWQIMEVNRIMAQDYSLDFSKKCIWNLYRGDFKFIKEVLDAEQVKNIDDLIDTLKL